MVAWFCVFASKIGKISRHEWVRIRVGKKKKVGPGTCDLCPSRYLCRYMWVQLRACVGADVPRRCVCVCVDQITLVAVFVCVCWLDSICLVLLPRYIKRNRYGVILEMGRIGFHNDCAIVPIRLQFSELKLRLMRDKFEKWFLGMCNGCNRGCKIPCHTCLKVQNNALRCSNRAPGWQCFFNNNRSIRIRDENWGPNHPWCCRVDNELPIFDI